MRFSLLFIANYPFYRKFFGFRNKNKILMLNFSATKMGLEQWKGIFTEVHQWKGIFVAELQSKLQQWKGVFVAKCPRIFSNEKKLSLLNLEPLATKNSFVVICHVLTMKYFLLLKMQQNSNESPCVGKCHFFCSASDCRGSTVRSIGFCTVLGSIRRVVVDLRQFEGEQGWHPSNLCF